MQFIKTQIIVVDDNMGFKEILCSYLSCFEEFEIIGTANNGIEAIQLIIEKEPDVVIMDIIMPQLDGIGVLEYLKTIKLEKRPQIIMLSAVSQDNTIQMALSSGADYYMVKPFDMNELVSRIKRLQSFENRKNYYANMKFNENEKLEIEERIIYILGKIGIPSHLKGYNYIKYAVEMVLEDLTVINSVTKVVYTSIAKKYYTTPTRVERSIRNAIEYIWDHKTQKCNDPVFLQKFNERLQRPTNSEFILMIAENFNRI